MKKTRGWPRGRQTLDPCTTQNLLLPRSGRGLGAVRFDGCINCSPKLLIYTFVVQISFVPWLKIEFEGISRIVFSFLKLTYIIKIICLLSSRDLRLVGRSVA